MLKPNALDLHFELRQGREANYFLRSGANAVHTAITSGEKPNFVIAFAGQNSAVSLWLDGAGRKVQFAVEQKPENLQVGRLHGVRFEMKANVSKLMVRKAILGSVRHVRHF